MVDGFLVEPEWIAVRRVRIGNRASPSRLIHFTDLHYKGDRTYLARVVQKINRLEPDFVCFTGDIVEDTRFLSAALDILADIKSPMFGVPGNHEYWSGASFSDIARCFESTGGLWLVDEPATVGDGRVDIFGATARRADVVQTQGDNRRILLTHYPAFADEIHGQRFDLILAGHSHGGQVRIPFFGAPILPDRVGDYDRGLFETSAGPLYVNPGIGTWYLPLRFGCRPEITVIEF
jgi:predicted MPP superfamily phosphohydrolase